ncbi:sulfite exporter TauE/SafE family protein [Quadrisphaera oryzae]|uniref:sulfite exporter TauE/SafE family protein n=1 Tax=Quadrisphaera TaxID=317661 RepID=UPI00164766E0|nr:sulfite exporter TauE/SafE family protein [Quadrisphaera sp. RL12-1S]
MSPLALVTASAAAFALALLSAVSGFGGGVLLLPVFTGLFGLRVAVPALTLVQLVSNGSRVAFNRDEVRWPLVGWFALGAVPLAVVGGLLLAQAPLAPLQRVLGVFLLAVVAWRRWRAHRERPPRAPGERAFVAVGAASGLGSALLGSVGPLTAPFFLAVGLTRAAYIGTEAASAVVVHVAKLGAYGAGDLLTSRVLLLGLVLSPASLAGAWVGRRVVGPLSERAFVVVVEVALVAAGALFLLGA